MRSLNPQYAPKEVSVLDKKNPKPRYRPQDRLMIVVATGTGIIPAVTAARLDDDFGSVVGLIDSTGSFHTVLGAASNGLVLKVTDTFCK